MKKIFLSAILLFLNLCLVFGQGQESFSKKEWDRLSEQQKKELLEKISKLSQVESPVILEKIHVPYQTWLTFLEKNQSLIRLHYKEFLALLEKAKENNVVHPPQSYPFQKMHLKGVQKEKDGELSWEGTWDLQVDQKGPLNFTLWADEKTKISRIESASINGQIAPLKSVGENLILYIPQEGKHVFKASFSSIWEKEKNQRKISLQIPGAPIATLSLEIQGLYQIQNNPKWLQVSWDPKGEKTFITGSIARVESLNLVLEKKFVEKQILPVHLLSTAQQSLFLGEGLIKLDATIYYQPMGGAIDEVKITLPQGFSLSSEPQIEKISRTWSLEKNILTLYFSKPIQENFTCTFSLVASPSDLFVLQPLRTGALMEKGRILVNLKKGYRLRHFQATELEQQSLDRTNSTSPSYGLWGVLDYHHKPYQISLSTEKIPLRFTSHLRLLLGFKEHQMMLKSALIFSILEGQMEAGKVELPSGFDLRKVTVPAGGKYEVAEGNLWIYPAEPVQKGNKLYVEVEMAREAQKEITLPQWKVVGSEELSGFLALSAPALYHLQPQGLVSLEPRDPQEMLHYGLKDPYLRLAYHFRGPYEGKILRISKESHITAKIHSMVTLRDGFAHVVSKVIFSIQNAPAREFSLKIPAQAFASLEITAPQAEIKLLPSSIKIFYAQPRNTQASLLLKYRLPLNKKGFSPELPFAEDVVRQSGNMALEVSDNLKVNLKVPSQVQEVDSRDLFFLPSGSRPFYACSYVGALGNFEVEMENFPQSEISSLVISSLHQEVQFDPQGASLCRARFQFYNLGAKELIVTLPPSSELWGATLMGKGIMPMEKDGQVLISLAQLKTNPGQAEILYLRKASSSSWFPQMEAHLPTSKFPILASSQKIFLPDGIPVLSFEGNMRGSVVQRELLMAKVGRWFQKNLMPFAKILIAFMAILLTIWVVFLFCRHFSRSVAEAMAATGLILFLGCLIFFSVPSLLKARKDSGAATESRVSKSRSYGEQDDQQKGSYDGAPRSMPSTENTSRPRSSADHRNKEIPLEQNAPSPALAETKRPSHERRERLDRDRDRLGFLQPSQPAGKARPSRKIHDEKTNEYLPKTPDKSIVLKGREKKNQLSKDQENWGETEKKPSDGKEGWKQKEEKKEETKKKTEEEDSEKRDEKEALSQNQNKNLYANLDQLFSKQPKVRGLNSLNIALRNEGTSYDFQGSSGAGYIYVKFLSPSSFYSILFGLALLTFIGGCFIGRGGKPSKIFYLSAAFLLSSALAILGGSAMVPFANGIALGALAVVAVFFFAGTFSLLGRRLQAYFLLFLAVMFLFPASAWAGEKSAEKEIPKYKVYVPYNAKDGKEVNPGQVYMPWDEYVKLVQKAKGTALVLPPMLSEGKYEGKINPQYLDWNITLSFHLPLQNRVVFPLRMPGIQISEWKGASLVSQDGEPCLLLESTNPVQKVELKGKIYPQGQDYSLVFPPAGAGVMELVNLDPSFDYMPSISASWKKNAQGHPEIKIPLGSLSKLTLSRQPKQGHLSRYQPTSKASQITYVYCYPGSAFLYAQWTLENSGEKARFEIDPSYKILRIQGGLPGEMKKDLDWKRDKELLTAFIPSASKEYEVGIWTALLLPQNSFVLPEIKALAILKRPTQIGFFSNSWLNLEVRHDGILGRCDPAVFGGRAKLAYTYLKPGKIEIIFQKPANLLSHKVRWIAYVEQDRISMDLYVQIQASQAPVYQVLLDLGKSLQIPGAPQCEGLLESVPLGEGKILLHFARPFSMAEKTLRIQGWIKPEKKQFELPHLSIPGSSLQETWIGVYRKKEIRLESSSHKGLKASAEQVSPLQGSVLPSFISALSFQAEKEYEGIFQLGSYPSQIQTRLLVYSQIRSQGVQYYGFLHYEIEQSPVEELILWIPESAHKSLLVEKNFHCGKAEKGFVPVYVQLSGRGMGKGIVRFSYATPLPSASPFSLDLPHCSPEYQREMWTALLFQGDEFSLDSKTHFEQISGLPAAFSSYRLTPQLVLERKDPKGKIGIECKKVAIISNLKALVRTAHLSAQIDQAGEMVARGIYRVQNHSHQFLEIEIPGDLWSTYVEGRVVTPSRLEKNRYLIPIPKRSQGDLSFDVEVVYHVTVWEHWKRFSTFHLPLPQVKGLPVDQTFLTLRVPQDYVYTFSDKNNLNPSSTSELHLNLASQMSEEFMDIVTLSKQAGYGDEKKVSSQKRYFDNQQNLLSNMSSNLEKAKNDVRRAPSPQQKVQLRKIEELENQLRFYQADLQNSSQKLNQVQSQKSPFSPGSYQQEDPSVARAQPLNGDEKDLSDSFSLNLQFPWEEVSRDSDELAAKLPAPLSEKSQIAGPSYFPASDSGFQLYHFHKSGGNPEMSFQIYPRQTTQGGKILVALLAALLLLLIAHKRNCLSFVGNSDGEKLRNACAMILLAILIYCSFAWYMVATILVLAGGADLFYQFKQWEKKHKAS